MGSARLPLQETSGNIPSPVLKKTRLNNTKPALQLNHDIPAEHHQHEAGKVNLASTTKPMLTNERLPYLQRPHPRTHHTKPAKVETAPQAKTTGRLAGEELYNWQQSWRKIMKESTVYFEGVTEYNPIQLSEYKKASRYLKQVGCEITPFYDNDVTIIISRRPYNPSKPYPPNDIFSNVSNLKIKVWDYDKVFRFLKNLGINMTVTDENSMNPAAAASASTSTALNETKSKHKDNLYNLLKEEKIYGTNDRDPNAKRDDLHYLEKNYLYVYDLLQKVRPIAIREWQEDSYPVLNLTLDGKCPFIFDNTESSNSERKKLRRLQKFEVTKDYRSLLKRATYDIISNIKNGVNMNTSGFSGTSTSTDRIGEDEVTIIQNSTSSKNRRVAAEEETDSMKPLRYNFKHPSIPALTRNSSCVQLNSNSKFYDVTASGYNGASNAMSVSMDTSLNSNAARGNGLGPMVSQVPSRNLNNLNRRIFIKKKKQESNNSFNEKAGNEEKELTPGYCENCRVKYDHFEDHIKSNRHRNFACDDRNFKDIDNLAKILHERRSLGYITSNGDFAYS
ncbi:uncharacterized protein CANTADRAFT_66923 [Suhomyces tanzawaensis NRRL Y-17324]|uniref:DBF4-type domain-containing protein n=1 Tax=Suhomyces tanzawaensis NRRL Y-17324 TaxID=984487 RepID=A0A1E4SIZ0_9ASCO|nr:uncharacterized protein CANTADRAFT_66923 [Suhomyces tanzawaensis NRRL Y-17324]ODV79475.1 hypothetical protein CANTADRAFT_66923 [Suhomyces tanzawaensis NRRL Y-17324]